MRKTSTLVIGTKSPGTCTTCRHSNQGTVDFREGHLFCWMDKRTKLRDQPCDVERKLPKTQSEAPDRWASYHLYEAFTGENGTYDQAEDLRLLAEDADEKLRRSLKADVPVER